MPTSVRRAEPSAGAVWRRRFANFWRRSAFERLWVLPAWLLLGFGRAVILVVPFRHIAPRLGRLQGAAPWVPLLRPELQERALRIGRTVRLAARLSPWTANCFPQAVAASLLLRLHRVPYALHFGLAPRGSSGEDRMKAHAWVNAGPVNVTGGRSFGHYTVVANFVGGPR